MKRLRPRSFFVLLLLTLNISTASAAEVGLFTGQTDIGNVNRPGTAGFDAETNVYTIGASGENIWGNRDDFHFVWREAEGDIALAADIAFVAASDQPHRKACIMIRQSLEPGSAYADVAIHGNRLISLQFREVTGGDTREVQSNYPSPRRVRLEKIGDWVYLSVAGADGVLRPSGCSVQLPSIKGKFFLGLGVCAHDNNAFETVTFSTVEIGAPSAEVKAVRSSLETIVIASTDRRSLYNTTTRIEAPNWSPDGKTIYFNGGGRIHRLRLDAGPDAKPSLVDTGFAVRCNNDHGLSPDGKRLVISDGTKPGGSRIYILPITGGVPREVTPLAPSYWHGWSPDGRTLTYTARRDGKWGIFTIPAAGGDETRLTTAPRELDDGPEYSPDGKWIYFNSDRSGLMQIWRMHPDGSNVEQVTSDDYNNWFAHPSPDGRWIVYLTYEKHIVGHPADQQVMLRLLPTSGEAEPRVLTRFFGGQGTINVPSWSPDSTKVAYVRYQPALAN